MNLNTLKVIYNCLVGLLVINALICYFFKNSLDPELLKMFVLSGVVLVACAIVVRILIFIRR